MNVGTANVPKSIRPATIASRVCRPTGAWMASMVRPSFPKIPVLIATTDTLPQMFTW
jgi:hypothetical protein